MSASYWEIPPASKFVEHLSAGVMARSVKDIILMDQLVSVCNTTIPSVDLEGLRVGYPTNWWSKLAEEVCFLHLTPLMGQCIVSTDATGELRTS